MEQAHRFVWSDSITLLILDPDNFMTQWDSKKSTELYNVAHWSDGHFSISDDGRLLVHPNADKKNGSVSLYEVVESARKQDLSLPLLVRFSGILHHRVQSLQQAFRQALAKINSDASYTVVYPIKVNQQHSVVEELLAGGGDQLGLEVGSKPELMAVISMAATGGTIVCNGYKDREYIRLALIGQAIGHRLTIVIEKLSELAQIIDEARELNIKPLLGVRLRLASVGKGKWQNTGGDKSKFGLSANDAIKIIDQLRQEEMLDCLQMVHFHMGSQISNLRDIQAGIREGARYYSELCKSGAPIRCINIGGGLGVDYEGSRSRSFCSVNYSVEDYAGSIVQAIWKLCKKEKLPFPNLISESGRALTAHHAMLLTNVLETEQIFGVKESSSEPEEYGVALQALQNILRNNYPGSAVEKYHDANDQMVELQSQFCNGNLSLSQRAYAERIFFTICQKVQQELNPDNRDHQKLSEELCERMADKYFLNFSLFRSLPDSWAIDQVFPVMPLHRLNERPSRRATIEDITCDSDGRIDLFPKSDGLSATVPMHSVGKNEHYLVGIFLLGAYQEILGDMHNLFGDTDSVHVAVSRSGEISLTNALRGDSVDHVLELVHFKPDAMRKVYQNKISNSGLDNKLQRQYLHELEDGLVGYTYLED